MTFQCETTVKFRHYTYRDNSPTTLTMQADISPFLVIPNRTRYRNCLLAWRWWKV